MPYHVGTMIELPRAALRAGEIAEERRVLLVRHQRPDPDDARRLARRRGVVPWHLYDQGHPAGRSVRDARYRRRRRTGQDRRASAAGRRGPTSSSASAASMAATRPRSPSARRRISTMFRVRRSACRSPGSLQRRPRWGERRIRPHDRNEKQGGQPTLVRPSRALA